MNEDGIIKICNTLRIAYGRMRTDYKHGKSNISISCPLAIKTHGDPHDDNMSCSVQVVDDGPSKVRCFSGNCSFKGSLLRLVKSAVEMRGGPLEMMEMLKEVDSIESVTLSGQYTRIGKQIQKQNVPQFRNRDRDVLSERVFEPFSGKIPQYAIDRGINIDTAKVWGLGYDKEGGYLVFPVRRRDGKLVGMVGRSVHEDASRRHHNYFGLDKTEHLFGAQMMESGKPIIIVESCIDALNTWQSLEGEASVVATLGEGFSINHVRQIREVRPRAAYIFTDGDRAGRLMGSKIANSLHGSFTIRLMECPWGPIIDATASGQAVRKKVDPSNLPPKMIRKLFDEARVVQKSIQWTDPPPEYVVGEQV